MIITGPSQLRQAVIRVHIRTIQPALLNNKPVRIYGPYLVCARRSKFKAFYSFMIPGELYVDSAVFPHFKDIEHFPWIQNTLRVERLFNGLHGADLRR